MKEPSTSRLKTDLPWWATLFAKIFYTKKYAKAVKKAAAPKALSSDETMIHFVNKGLPPVTLFKVALDSKSDKYLFIIKQFMNQDNFKSFYDSMLTNYSGDVYRSFEISPFTLKQEDFNSFIQPLFYNLEKRSYFKVNIIEDLFAKGLKLNNDQLKSVLTESIDLKKEAQDILFATRLKQKYKLLLKQYPEQVLAEADFYINHAIQSQNKTLLGYILNIPEISNNKKLVDEMILKIIDSSNENLLEFLSPYKDRLETFSPSLIERALMSDKLNTDFFSRLSKFYSFNIVDKELSIILKAMDKLVTEANLNDPEKINYIFYCLVYSINSTLRVYNSNLLEKKYYEFRPIIKNLSIPLHANDKSKIEVKFKEIFKELYDKAAEVKPDSTPKTSFKK